MIAPKVSVAQLNVLKDPEKNLRNLNLQKIYKDCVKDRSSTHKN